MHSNLTDYVTLTRIQFAANLLRYHHYTITQAAQEVGIPVVPYPPVQAHHRRDAVPLRPIESHQGLRDEPAKRKILQRRSASLQCSAAWYYNFYKSGKLYAAPAGGHFMILQTGFRTDIPGFTARGLRTACVQGLCWCETLMIRSPSHGMPSTRMWWT